MPKALQTKCKTWFGVPTMILYGLLVMVFSSFWSLTQRQTFPVSIFCKILWVSSNSKMCDVTASVKIKRLVNRFIGSPPERSQIVHTFCRRAESWKELVGQGVSIAAPVTSFLCSMHIVHCGFAHVAFKFSLTKVASGVGRVVVWLHITMLAT